MKDEYRQIFWRLIPIVVGILLALIGAVWGVTYAELSRRINRMDDIILEQKETVARIEAKLDILLQKTGEDGST